MAFAQKLLRITFTLSGGTFAASGKNTLTVSGLKTQATVENVGMFAGCKLILSIYGMTLSQMNDLSSMGPQIPILKPNSVMLEASSDGGANYFTVFMGIITTATVNPAMPDVSFQATANSVAGINVTTPAPYSVNGVTNVANLLQALATQGGLNFENNAGVNVTIRYPYLWGSIGDNIKELCEAAGINWVIQNGTLAIWPRTGSRTASGQVASVISPTSGLAGLPTYTPYGVLLKTLFNPAIIFGGLVEIQSELLQNATAQTGGIAQRLKLPASGIYAVNQLNHELDSWVPNGKWFSDIYAVNPEYFVVGLGG